MGKTDLPQGADELQPREVGEKSWLSYGNKVFMRVDGWENLAEGSDSVFIFAVTPARWLTG